VDLEGFISRSSSCAHRPVVIFLPSQPPMTNRFMQAPCLNELSSPFLFPVRTFHRRRISILPFGFPSGPFRSLSSCRLCRLDSFFQDLFPGYRGLKRVVQGRWPRFFFFTSRMVDFFVMCRSTAAFSSFFFFFRWYGRAVFPSLLISQPQPLLKRRECFYRFVVK